MGLLALVTAVSAGAVGPGLHSLVTASLTYRDDEGNVITSTPPGGSPQTSVSVTLSELALQPMDVLALSEALAQPNQGSMLDRRIVAVAVADPARDPDATPTRVEVPAIQTWSSLSSSVSLMRSG